MKILKKTLKISGITFGVIILLMLIISIAAKIFEDDIAKLTIDSLENEIDAPMSIGKVSLNPVFSFPRLSVEINQFWIGEPENNNNDTLFYINSLKAGLNSWDLMFGAYTINKLEISGLDFDYIINKNGKTNIDFITAVFVDTVPDIPENRGEGKLDFSIDKFKIDNININYYDSTKNIASQIYIPEIDLKLKTKNDVYKANARGEFIISDSRYENTPLDKMNSCSINFDMDYKNKQLNIQKLSIVSEGINFDIEGAVNIDNAIGADVVIRGHGLDFNILQKYYPEIFTEFYGNSELFKTNMITANIKMNYKDDNADLESFSLISDGIKLDLDGKIILKDTISLDTKINELALDLGILKKYIPKKYSAEYGIQEIAGSIDITAAINGKYSDSTLMPMINANVNMGNIVLKTTKYPQIESLNLIAKLSNGEKIDMSDATVDITNLDVKSPKSSFKLNGSFSNLTKLKYKFTSNMDLNLEEFEKFIPDSLAKYPHGNITASIQTSGVLSDKFDDIFIDKILNSTNLSVNLKNVSALVSDSLYLHNISTEIDFSPLLTGDKRLALKKFYLKSEQLNLDIKNSSVIASLSGKYSDLSKAKFSLESFRLESRNNLISGKGVFKNLDNPDYEINSTIVLNLQELMPFVPDSLLNSMSGIVRTDVYSKGKINTDSLDSQMYSIIFENSNFECILNNISLAFPDTIMNIDNFSSRLSLKDDILKVDNFNATYNGLKIQMDSTIVKNIYKTIIQNTNEELFVDTRIKIGDIIYDDFKHFMEYETPSNESATEEPSIKQNWTFLIHGKATVNSIIVDSTKIEDYNINRLHINDLSTLFKLTDSAYILDQFKFKAFEGEMNNSIHYKLREDGTTSVSTHNIISGMNIRTLLRDFDNFGMDSLISYKNISGLLSTDLNTFIPIEDTVIVDRINVSGEIVLEEGGVYDYEPAEELSKFTGLKELDNIQFKTLRSNIFMYKNKLYVPRTNIVSNALDIAAFGMQSMKDESEYHLEIMSNILFGKSKRRNKKQEESGEEIDKSLLKKNSKKVRYATKNGKSRIAIDSPGSRENMMLKIRLQEKMLNFIFFPKNIHYNTEINNKE